MICKHCGANYDGLYCPECGTKADASTSDNSMSMDEVPALEICHVCGKEYEGKYCPNCGTPAGKSSKIQESVKGVIDRLKTVPHETLAFGIAGIIVLCVIIGAFVFSAVRSLSYAAAHNNEEIVADSDAVVQNDEQNEYYEKAIAHLKDWQYAAALEDLNNVSDRDVSDLISFCDYMIQNDKIWDMILNGNYGDAYKAANNLPECSETSDLLESIRIGAAVNLEDLENDFISNSVRAKEEYTGKFFVIDGVCKGTSSALLSGENYLMVKVGDCSDYANCYGLSSAEIMSVSNGESVCLVGYFSSNNGWIGIDFKSCSMYDTSKLTWGWSIYDLYDLPDELDEQFRYSNPYDA